AGKNNQRLGKLSEPQLAHEKIMKHETQLRTDVVIGPLFVGQFNAQANGFSARLSRAAISRFHNPGPSAGANYEATRMIAERHRPGGDPPRQLSRLFIITGHS